MKKIILLFITVLYIGMTTSCSYMIYAPNPEVIEPVNTKGQLETSIYVGYSNTQKYGLAANYSFAKNLAVTANAAYGIKQKHLSIAGGYYKMVSKNNYVDLYGGVTFGNGYGVKRGIIRFDYEELYSSYKKSFIRAGYHLGGNKLQLDLNISVGALDFTQFIVSNETKDLSYVNKILEITPSFIIEPSIRLAFKYQKSNVFIGFVYRPKYLGEYGIHNSNLFMGASTNLGKAKKESRRRRRR